MEKTMKYNDIKKFSRRLRNHQTPFERILWERLKNRQIMGFKFLRQHPIMYDRHGNDLNFFIPDFYCSKARLAIEVDGGIHDDKRNHDAWREEILQHMQIRILRFRNEKLIDLDEVVKKIEKHLVYPPPGSLPFGREK